ncbi:MULTISPECIES: transcriptional repressor LexA [Bacillaceae]|jgi:repressor LexA|uniref:LexA repressor n=1 Tax=Gottfriedia luciferensis TaxID=178774 RepID=A0ABX2ZX80_9BACI|nr:MULTISPECIES: transcriptional repressor LexA [Bacillaceae]ODG93265.1 repressor LexA [Gottfriedia luciferensis]PGZ95084.1 transcriptional repressor LexA [Bacillus sp. AFS029533]SFC53994.1 repressor LexA [Bacillus sp. UNCCL81]
MNKLSKRQAEILAYIKDEVKIKGYPPSVREIAEAVGLASSSTVHGHLERLEQKGYIRRDPTKPRAIEILGDTAAVVNEVQASYSEIYNDIINIPVIGKVTAGIPITAVENVEEYFPLPTSVAPSNEQVFMLRVEGDSMINAGILNGDLVIVKKQFTAENGEIVVAMTEDSEATVKRFYKESDHFRLQPENDALFPILLKQVSILGKVIGVYRTYH